MSTLGRQTLQTMGVPVPDEEGFPTGQEYYDSYLQVIGKHLDQDKDCDIQLRTKVVSVVRAGMLKGDMSQSRKEKKFNILSETTSSTGKVGTYKLSKYFVAIDLSQVCRECDARF